MSVQKRKRRRLKIDGKDSPGLQGRSMANWLQMRLSETLTQMQQVTAYLSKSEKSVESTQLAARLFSSIAVFVMKMQLISILSLNITICNKKCKRYLNRFKIILLELNSNCPTFGLHATDTLHYTQVCNSSYKIICGCSNFYTLNSFLFICEFVCLCGHLKINLSVCGTLQRINFRQMKSIIKL